MPEGVQMKVGVGKRADEDGAGAGEGEGEGERVDEDGAGEGKRADEDHVGEGKTALAVGLTADKALGSKTRCAGCVPDALAARGRTGRDSLCIFVFVFVFDVSLGVDGEGGFADGKSAPRMASRMAAEPPSMHAVCTHAGRFRHSSPLINLDQPCRGCELSRTNSPSKFATTIHLQN